MTIVYADRFKLNQILLNLLNNSIKYNKEDGNVEIYLEEEPHKEPQYVTIMIKDTGYGVSTENQEKIFEPFYRVKEFASYTEGTGIGLSLVKQHVEDMFGEVGVKSEEMAGSTFWVKFPLKKRNILCL
nr:ATP-binding protein [Alkalihalophilus marmarensis]